MLLCECKMGIRSVKIKDHEYDKAFKISMRCVNVNKWKYVLHVKWDRNRIIDVCMRNG